MGARARLWILLEQLRTLPPKYIWEHRGVKCCAQIMIQCLRVSTNNSRSHLWPACYILGTLHALMYLIITKSYELLLSSFTDVKTEAHKH